MSELLYIANWNALPWFSTGGTRAKKYIQSPDGKFYYFKRSQFKPATDSKLGKDFKYEFWSEIIAYRVGKLLEFNVLKYGIAADANIMGCISESMIDSDKEELITGVQYLQAFNRDYEPENKAHRNWYSFQFIEGALRHFQFEKFIPEILEMIIFDSIIGNGDRHQENWAIINEYSDLSKQYRNIELDLQQSEGGKKGKLASVLEWFSERTNKKVDLEKVVSKVKLRSHNVKCFAPIYDNGSSLGRELTDERVLEYLNDDAALAVYIEKGLAEIHWNGQKVSHFQLIQNILEGPFAQDAKNIISRVVNKFDGMEIEELIQKIDIWVPEYLGNYKIPRPRKQLIMRLIQFRFERLKGLLHA